MFGYAVIPVHYCADGLSCAVVVSPTEKKTRRETGVGGWWWWGGGGTGRLLKTHLAIIIRTEDNPTASDVIPRASFVTAAVRLCRRRTCDVFTASDSTPSILLHIFVFRVLPSSCRPSLFEQNDIILFLFYPQIIWRDMIISRFPGAGRTRVFFFFFNLVLCSFWTFDVLYCIKILTWI